MSFDDWLLALHVLSAFAYVAGVVLFWILIVAVRRIDPPEASDAHGARSSRSETPPSRSAR